MLLGLLWIGGGPAGAPPTFNVAWAVNSNQIVGLIIVQPETH